MIKLLIILLITFYFIFIRNKYIFEGLTNNYKISVIILNYKRPYNLHKSLDKLNKYEKIDEIIVGHGNPDFYRDFKYSKVKNIKDYENNKKYGCGRRVFLTKYARNNLVMFLDDDMLPSEDCVNKFYKTIMDNYNKNTIFGNIIRICNTKGYVDIANVKTYNTILIGQSIMKKSLILDYLNDKNGIKKYSDWLEKHHGNCEDLSINKFIKEKYNEKGIYIPLCKYKELDKNNGYSSQKNHYVIRNKFCKKYSII